MRIIYHNRHPLPASQSHSATYVSFNELLATADVISLNLSLNASTRHIIGAREFEKMKDGVIVINTARGALVDEKALVGALQSGKVWSVGLDVFEEEPAVSEELMRSENVVVLPHIGTGTFETQVCYIFCLYLSLSLYLLLIYRYTRLYDI
jgi:glyoxylate reductase